MSIYSHKRALKRIEEKIENAAHSVENKRLIIRFARFLLQRSARDQWFDDSGK